MAKGKHSKEPVKPAKWVGAVCVLALALTFAARVFPNYADQRFSDGQELAKTQGEEDSALNTPTLAGLEDDSTALDVAEQSDALESAQVELAASAEQSPPPSEMQLEVEGLSQFPELPCGCEITAAASLLNYIGVDVSAVTLDGYLAQGLDSLNPHEQFIGYCASIGWTCYVEPVAQACNAYLEEIGLADSYVAIDLTGISAQELYDNYIAQGIPVCVWVTTYLQEREVADSWYVGDEYVSISQQDHCMALCGYTQDSVTLMDPLEGSTMQYPRSAFEESFASRDFRAMAVIDT